MSNYTNSTLTIRNTNTLPATKRVHDCKARDARIPDVASMRHAVFTLPKKHSYTGSKSLQELEQKTKKEATNIGAVCVVMGRKRNRKANKVQSRHIGAWRQLLWYVYDFHISCEASTRQLCHVSSMSRVKHVTRQACHASSMSRVQERNI